MVGPRQHASRISKIEQLPKPFSIAFKNVFTDEESLLLIFFESFHSNSKLFTNRIKITILLLSSNVTTNKICHLAVDVGCRANVQKSKYRLEPHKYPRSNACSRFNKCRCTNSATSCPVEEFGQWLTHETHENGQYHCILVVARVIKDPVSVSGSEAWICHAFVLKHSTFKFEIHLTVSVFKCHNFTLNRDK